ncbi:F-box protein [Phanerochaete sordida]|uniref:F-box protein n=1 Tax=Phanerochaete sordida TaxID=48140 RepID=A0A9P3G402_9APHY|nr:F-box protein [Phanerochaete sordida]
MDNMSNPSRSSLPVELLHEILQLLDGATLKTCAQVSKTWLDISRTHLFRKLVHDVHLEEDGMVSQADGTPVILQDLLEYLEDTPAVRGYIQQLALRVPRQTPLVTWGANHERQLQLCRFETLINILARLPSLSSLVVDGIPFHTPESPADVRPVVDSPVVPSIKKLTLRSWWRNGSTSHADILLHLLSLFGEVQHLDLGAIHHLPRPASALLAVQIITRIRALTFGDVDALNAVHQLPNLWQLSSLAMPNIAPKEAAIAATLTHAARDSLRHLEIKLHEAIVPLLPGPHDLSYLDTLELASCTKLESLSVTVCMYKIASPPRPQLVGPSTQASFYEPAYAYLTRLLAALPPTLSTLTFNVNHNISADFTFSRDRSPAAAPMQTDWTTLDRVLTDRLANKGLQSIEFKGLEGGRLRVVERKHIIEALPKTWRSGKVRFS